MTDAPGQGSGELSREEFVELAGRYRVVPVWREILADTITPVGAFAGVVGDAPGYLLESVEGGERWGRYSFVGRSSLATIVSEGGRVSVQGAIDLPAHVAERTSQGILATLDALLTEYRVPRIESLPPLHSGLVGYLGYDVVREVEALGEAPVDDLGFPDATLMVIGQICAFDHWRQRVVLIDNVPTGRGLSRSDAARSFDAARSRLDGLAEELTSPVVEPPFAIPEAGGSAGWPEVRRSMSSAQYMAAVDVAKDHITAGDVFQVVISQRFDMNLEAEPFDVYRVLRVVNPSPYLYFLRTPSLSVVGSSPEPMVRLRDGVVVSRPIAGTRRRGSTPSEDVRLAGELAENPKELAEHVMLVDLARNDVGRVVDYGSERVDELMTVERYSHVMHLTSQVSGRLSAGKGPVDVLRATMPAGTLSGAPKVRAMQIIDELEVTKRGVYGGVVGYFDFSGNLDTAIAIRTMIVAPDGRASIQAGAGIVADSDPAEEDAECLNKAAALLAAVGPARAMTILRGEHQDLVVDRTAGAERNPRARDTHAPEPRPAAEIGEAAGP